MAAWRRRGLRSRARFATLIPQSVPGSRESLHLPRLLFPALVNRLELGKGGTTSPGAFQRGGAAGEVIRMANNAAEPGLLQRAQVAKC